MTQVPDMSLKSSASRPSNIRPWPGLVLVDEADGVARPVEAFVVERRCRRVRVAVIAGCDVGPGQRERQLVALWDQLQGDARKRHADAAAAGRHEVRGGRSGRRFGRPPRRRQRHMVVGDVVGDRAQPVPQRLGESRRGVEHEAQAGEEHGGEVAVALQPRSEQRIADRHVVVGGRRESAKRVHRAIEEPRHRFAVVDVQRPSEGQDLPEVVVGTERVAPRQPVDEHGRLLAQERPDLAERLLVGAQHAVGVHDALRGACRPRGEEQLGDSVGPDAVEGVLDRLSRDRRHQLRIAQRVRALSARDQLRWDVVCHRV